METNNGRNSGQNTVKTRSKWRSNLFFNNLFDPKQDVEILVPDKNGEYVPVSKQGAWIARVFTFENLMLGSALCLFFASVGAVVYGLVWLVSGFWRQIVAVLLLAGCVPLVRHLYRDFSYRRHLRSYNKEDVSASKWKHKTKIKIKITQE